MFINAVAHPLRPGGCAAASSTLRRCEHSPNDKMIFWNVFGRAMETGAADDGEMKVR